MHNYAHTTWPLSNHTTANSSGIFSSSTNTVELTAGKNNRNSTKHNRNTDFRTRKDF